LIVPFVCLLGIYIFYFINALKTSWIRKVINDDCKCLKIITKDVDALRLTNCGIIYTQNCIKENPK